MTAFANFSAVLAAATAVPVVTGGELTAETLTTLPSGDVVVGILDPTSTQRLFNPFAEGLSPTAGDTLNLWLPSPNANTIFGAALTATEIVDNYWAPVFASNNEASFTGLTGIGQVQLYLTPGQNNTVESPSVMTFKLSPQAVLLMISGTNTFSV
jgi:hypothetical protein